MELKVDLSGQEKKSVLRIIIGIFFIMVSIFWAFSRYNNNLDINTMDWFFFAVMILNGFVHMWGGFGLPIISLFSESFIMIDDEKISVKKRVLTKKHSILWTDVKMINYKFNRFKVIKTNDTILTLDFSKLEYAVLNNAKEFIGKLAKEKGVQVNL